MARRATEIPPLDTWGATWSVLAEDDGVPFLRVDFEPGCQDWDLVRGAAVLRAQAADLRRLADALEALTLAPRRAWPGRQ